MLSQSTQTEVNEHVCPQWEASISEPAVVRLEGNYPEWPLLLSVIHISSQCLVFTTIFSSPIRLSVRILMRKMSLHFWIGAAEVMLLYERCHGFMINFQQHWLFTQMQQIVLEEWLSLLCWQPLSPSHNSASTQNRIPKHVNILRSNLWTWIADSACEEDVR